MPKTKIPDQPTDLVLRGFKTRKQAEEFLIWYGNSGEQAFYDHLDIVGLDPEDGCNLEYSKKEKDVAGVIIAHVS